MNRDRLITIAAFALGLAGAFEIVNGAFIIGIVLMVVGGISFWFRGSSKYNDKSLYEKVIRSNGITVSDIFQEIRDMETSLGKPWLAGHVGYPGESIVFGPNRFKDMVVISYDDRRDEFSIKHMNKVDNIRYDSANAYRFQDLIEAADIDVTPASYSEYAAEKVICSILLMHLVDMIDYLGQGNHGFAPESLDTFGLRYYNSGEGFISDTDGNRYYTVDSNHEEFRARVLDTEGNEIGRVDSRAVNKKGRPSDSAGYDIIMNGQHWADMERKVQLKHDTFFVQTNQGQMFQVANFIPVQRGNLTLNYTITLGGKLVAVVGGNDKLDFDGYGICENDLILSFDDRYMDFYSTMVVFLMTINDFAKK